MIIDYFEFRWERYKYFVFVEYSQLVEQLPADRIDLLLRGIVYRPFLDHYSHVLTYEKNIRYTHARYTWFDEEYRQYMRRLLSILEPYHVHQDEILIHELDEFQQVTFFICGKYEIGYSMNRKYVGVKHFDMDVKANPIGAYGVSFFKRATIIYKTISNCVGHFIRKKNWIKMLNDLEYNLRHEMLKTFLKDYMENTKKKIIIHKTANYNK